jgi:tripartite-type tricarboxylate transporter receptor subunit TctC
MRNVKYLVFIFALFIHSFCIAAGYPERSVRVVIPFPPGGGTDGLARILTPKISNALGQQFIVDNRPGAGGNISTEIVASAPPDGYTLLMTISTALTVNPLLYANLNFDVNRDLKPITQIAAAQYILVLHPSIPASNVKELIALAKARPGKLNYASGGIGNIQHFASEQLIAKTGVKITHIPYKGGGPAAVAVLSGEADMIFGSVASSVPQITAGKLKAIAVTGSKRMPMTFSIDKKGSKGPQGKASTPLSHYKTECLYVGFKTSGISRAPCNMRTMVTYSVVNSKKIT